MVVRIPIDLIEIIFILKLSEIVSPIFRRQSFGVLFQRRNGVHSNSTVEKLHGAYLELGTSISISIHSAIILLFDDSVNLIKYRSK